MTCVVNARKSDEVVLKLPDAVHVEAARAARAGAAALIRVSLALHARHQIHQVVPTSQQEWELGDILVIHHRAERRVLRGEHGGSGLHRRDSSDRAHRQREVLTAFFRRVQRHFADGLLESRFLHGN